MKEQFKYILSTLVIISITVLWVNAWNWLIAGNWDTLDATKWNQLVRATTPTWAIMAFNLSSCPTWWTAADWTNSTPDLRGAFVRWIWWDTNWRDVARTLGDYQDASTIMWAYSNPTPSILKSDNTWNVWLNWSTASNKWNANLEELTTVTTNPAFLMWYSSYASAATSTSIIWKIRPKNIALLYCIKQ